MQERLNNLFSSTKNTIQNLSKKAKTIIIAVLLVIAFALIGVVLLNILSPYQVLFTGLEQAEVSEITTKLEEMGIESRTESGGTILVPASQQEQLKIQLVSEGYPESGYTYDYRSSNIDMLSTGSDRDFWEQADFQQMVATTIESFDGVKDATVIYGIAEDSSYILDNDESENTASVTVIMENGGSPDPEQVSGIQRLVAKSVPDLLIDNVVILDGNGIEVTQSATDLQLDASELKLELEREFEQNATQKILHLFSDMFNTEEQDGIKVAVNAVVDVDKSITEAINYIPSEDNRGVVSGETLYFEGDDVQAEGGVPGATSNADIETYPVVTEDGESYIFTDQRDYDYVVSEVREQVQSDAANVVDTSIGITINGIDIDAQTLSSMKRVIANATGIPIEDADEKIEILSSPFLNGEPVEPTTPVVNQGVIEFLLDFDTSLPILIAAGVMLIIMIIFIIIAVISKRKAKKARLAMEQQKEEYEALLAAEKEAANVESIEELRRKNQEKLDDFKLGQMKDTKEKKLKGEIGGFVNDNPEISAQLIKNWLRGGDLDESTG